jgi:hypothetical protein
MENNAYVAIMICKHSILFTVNSNLQSTAVAPQKYDQLTCAGMYKYQQEKLHRDEKIISSFQSTMTVIIRPILSGSLITMAWHILWLQMEMSSSICKCIK